MKGSGFDAKETNSSVKALNPIEISRFFQKICQLGFIDE